MTRKLMLSVLSSFFCCICITAKPIHQYVFFNLDRQRISEPSFLQTKTFEGAQIKYKWRDLEPKKDIYDFSAIRRDLALLTSKGKKLFIQLQDVSFDNSIINVPVYLLEEDKYGGGASRQYDIKNDDETQAVTGGWVARRWDPAVQERFRKLLFALGKEFDGKIEGINLPETSVTFGESGKLFPRGFTFEIYRDAVIANMKALKQAFPKSVAMQYANYMPGEWLPKSDKSYLSGVYKQAEELKIAVGGPDLLPYKPGQMNHAYRFIKEMDGKALTGIAVQDGNYAYLNPQTGKQVTVAELLDFAENYLKVDYIFWGTQEPFYSDKLIPFLKAKNKPGESARQVAVTFDDLPYQGKTIEIAALKRITTKLLNSLKSNDVPAFGDVNERKLYADGKPDAARIDILRMWLDAGFELGNHTFSHADFQTTSLADYGADFLRGEKITKKLMQEKGLKIRYFRHPVLHTGSDLKSKTAFERFLTEHNYAVAPVTIDNQDFMFADIYDRAKKRGDTATMKRVADAYIPYMERMFEFFEQLSKDSLGYEVKQILLLNANELNADCFEALARMMKKRNYSFISLEEALKDKAYSLPDTPSSKGLSWIHRWMLAKGEEMRPEPREPEFITQLFKNYGGQ